MKDYNYYKTISDICNEANDIYKKFNVEEIIPLGKKALNSEPDEGDSFLLKSGENKYLMVEVSTEFRWVGSRSMLNEINDLDCSFARYLHDYEQEDHRGKRRRLFVFSYIEGETVKDYLSKADKNEAYNLGKGLGQSLKKVHAPVVDFFDHHISNWHERYKWTQKSILNGGISNSIQEKAFKYYEENKDIISRRYSSSEYYHRANGNFVLDENGNAITEKVLSFIFNDITLENLIVSKGQIYIKCPINIAAGDPFYDFKYLSLIAMESEALASGIIDGYFEGKISKDFFKMLKYYTSELIIKEYGKSLDDDTVNKIYEFYDDFSLEIPKWYNGKSL